MLGAIAAMVALQLSDLVRTLTTRIRSHPALTARADLESRIERKLYAALRTGRKFTGDLATNKSLAEQTAKATTEISEQVTAIQSASGQTVAAIQDVANVIGEIDQISAAIALGSESRAPRRWKSR